MAELVIERVPVESLEAHPRNPRQGDVGAIVESLEAHGQYRPLVVQAATNYVLAGNHTLMAATALGWSEIDVVRLDVDDDQALRILLVDNRTSDLAAYDDHGLADLLASIAPDFTGTAWDPDDLDALIRATEGPPDLAALAESLGPPGEGLGTSMIRLLVPPAIALRWREATASLGDTDADKVAAVLDRAGL